MTAGWALVIVVAASGAAYASPEQPVARYAPKGHPSLRSGVSAVDATDYLYVGMRETVGAHSAGAGATILQADPAVGDGDLQPHVFAFHWVDGLDTCYNACGWVQVSPSKHPGMRIVPGEAHRYEIKLVHGDWWLFYDGEGMGYYPQSLWNGGFAQAALVQWFGEVAAAMTSPCTQMGNGKLGADASAASYADLHLFDPDGT